MNKSIHLGPFIKWPGGKTTELDIIKEYRPKNINRYFEPFLGGGSVYFSLEFKKAYINDISTELMDLYKLIQNQDQLFFQTLDDIIRTWGLLEKVVVNHIDELIDIYKLYTNTDEINVPKALQKKIENTVYEFVIKYSDEFNGLLKDDFDYDIEHFLLQIKKSFVSKLKRMHKIETERGLLPKEDLEKNLETIFKSAYYTHFRHLYNYREKYNIPSEYASALFYFIREYCYSSMFRYNSSGYFNVPYGGISYNRKGFNKKIEYVKSEELKKYLSKTKIYHEDFAKFLNRFRLKDDDFIFLDPPYDTEFSTYANNEFSKYEQIRLADYLKSTKAKFLLIIKYTDFIYDLYNIPEFNIIEFDKNYQVSFKNRNDKNVTHIIVRNYE